MGKTNKFYSGNTTVILMADIKGQSDTERYSHPSSFVLCRLKSVWQL